jgi:phage terminase small subunit
MSNVSPANQHTSDEREQKCWDFYVESIVNGTENAYASAVKAGYSEDHSRNITIQGWFNERKQKLKRKEMLSKAEKVLQKTLDYLTEDQEGKVKVDLLRVQTDVAKHVTGTLGKDEGYSTRTEQTGKDGEKLFQGLTEEDQAKLDLLLK